VSVVGPLGLEHIDPIDDPGTGEEATQCYR
jgi:hypothetical protein